MNTCTNCDQPARSRGLCEPHYRRALRAEKARKTPAELAASRDRTRAARIEHLRKGQQTQTARSDERLAELVHLLDGGVWPPSACARLGWTVDAAVAAARRRGSARVNAALGKFRSTEREVAA